MSDNSPHTTRQGLSGGAPEGSRASGDERAVPSMSGLKRTHYCGDLRKDHIGQEVVLFGWVNRQRDMGNLVFIDLRDRQGLAQVTVSSDTPDLLEQAKTLKMEYVVAVRGKVRERGEGLRNPEMPTGEVEVEAQALEVLNASAVPPFMIADPTQASEDLRFKYRYLDLRRARMQRNFKLRHQAALIVRNFLSGQGFLEIETPFLTKSTPEGARDYLVPSRVYKGRFFALPQSPQIFKQLLMVSGFDRYFQIVRCFRDEDLRADRQPEFTQIDIEMSFIRRDELFEIGEGEAIEARLMALRAIGKAGSRKALKPLVRALQDSDWAVRAHAAAAIGTIGADRRGRRALERLVASDPHPFVVASAAAALDSENR